MAARGQSATNDHDPEKLLPGVALDELSIPALVLVTDRFRLVVSSSVAVELVEPYAVELAF